jgi:coronin-7
MEFSPFDDGLLATGSEDATVKLWNISSDRSSPECTFVPAQDVRVETLRFHPTSDFLLSSSAGDRIQIVDLVAQKELIGKFHQRFFCFICASQ